MRTAALAVIALGVYGLSACKGTESTMDRRLSEDLALASSNDGLNLTPNGNQGTVSPLEQTQHSSIRAAPSERARVSRATRTPVQLAVQTQSEALIATPVVSITPTPDLTPEPTIVAPAPIPTPRPRPIAVESPRSPTVGPNPGSGSSNDDSNIIDGAIRIGGAMGGAVLRGGVVDRDHCDPRTDRRRGGNISINNRIPTPRTF